MAARASTGLRKPIRRKPEIKKDISKSYNQFKKVEGQQYTGMKVGRSHKWYYDKGEWREKKITPDEWEINYAVTKRRAGKAPEGSGVPVGTEYHWYILAHQNVRKLNANDYTTAMTGLKFKLSHKRAGSEKWSTSEKAERRRLIKIFQRMIAQLEAELQEPTSSNGKNEEATPSEQNTGQVVAKKTEAKLNSPTESRSNSNAKGKESSKRKTTTAKRKSTPRKKVAVGSK